MVATPTNLTKGGSGTGATSYTTASVTFTAGRFYLITFTSRTAITTDPTQPAATGTGMTFSIVPTNGTQIYDNTSSSRKRQTLFYSLCASTTTTTVVFDQSGQSQTGAEWTIDEIASGLVVTGTNGIDAIVQSAKNFDGSATGLTVSTTLGAFSSVNNATYGSLATSAGVTNTLSAGSGMTMVAQSATSTNTDVGSEFSSSNVTSVGFSFSENTELGIIALELQASAVTGVSLGTSRMLMGVGS